MSELDTLILQLQHFRTLIGERDEDIERLEDRIKELEEAYDSLTEADTEVIGEQRRRIEELEGVPCRTCKGKGYTLTRVNVTDLWRRECPTCKGKGWIEKPA